MSDEHLSRRGFLGAAAAAAVVFGFPLDAWSDDKKTTKAWKEALETAKARKQPIVALVVPEGAAEARALGAALEKVVPETYRSDRDAARLFLEAVWVCVPGSLVEAKAGETAVLCDESGKRLAGGTVDLESAAKLVKSALKLLDTDGRRAARVKAAREAGATALLEALVAADKDPNLPPTAQDRLREKFDEWACALLDDAEKKSASPWVERTARGRYDSLVEAGAKALPYGVQWEMVEGKVDPCPPCGRAQARTTARKFIEFLTKPE